MPDSAMPDSGAVSSDEAVPSTQAWVDTDDGVRLYAEVTEPAGAESSGPHDQAADGRDAVTVVLSHGWTISRLAWSEVADRLAVQSAARPAARPASARPASARPAETAAHRLRVIRYDQRGHGRSTQCPDEPATMARLGRDLGQVVRELAPTGPVVLAGHSMGGISIMAFAAEEPEYFAERVAGVALVATSAGEPPATAAAATSRRDGRPSWISGRSMRWLMAAGTRWPVGVDRLRRLLPPPRARAHWSLAQKMLYGPSAPVATVVTGTELLAATPMRTITAFYPPLVALDQFAALERLTGVPVTILVGERDRLTPPRHSRALAEAIPQARLVVLPDHGHMLPLECPDEVTTELMRLVEQAGDDDSAPGTNREVE